MDNDAHALFAGPTNGDPPSGIQPMWPLGTPTALRSNDFPEWSEKDIGRIEGWAATMLLARDEGDELLLDLSRRALYRLLNGHL